MFYGKLEKDSLIFAPNFIEVGKFNVWNAPQEEMLKAGWKPIKFTEPPEPPKAEYEWRASWKETETEIIEVWTEVPIEKE